VRAPNRTCSPRDQRAAFPCSALAGNYVAVALAYNGVAIIDVVDPAAPRLVGEYTLPGRARALLATDDLLYVADREGGLYVLRLTAAPSSAGDPKDVS
jgi:hypothetical protein